MCEAGQATLEEEAALCSALKAPSVRLLWGLCDGLAKPRSRWSHPLVLTHLCVPVSHQESCPAAFLWPGDPVRGWIPTQALQQEENAPFLKQGGWSPGEG